MKIPMRAGLGTVSAIALALSTAHADTAHADPAIRGFDGRKVSAERIDREATRMMAAANVQGLAMAVIDDGKVVFVRSWGRRNVERNLPLQTDTIMYGASLTKLLGLGRLKAMHDQNRVQSVYGVHGWPVHVVVVGVGHCWILGGGGGGGAGVGIGVTRCRPNGSV